jgi:hypothetical protein
LVISEFRSPPSIRKSPAILKYFAKFSRVLTIISHRKEAEGTKICKSEIHKHKPTNLLKMGKRHLGTLDPKGSLDPKGPLNLGWPFGNFFRFFKFCVDSWFLRIASCVCVCRIAESIYQKILSIQSCVNFKFVVRRPLIYRPAALQPAASSSLSSIFKNVNVKFS